MNLQTLRTEAVELHQKGNLAEAEQLYLQILQVDPANFTANHLLGLIRFQQGRNPEALNLIGAAVKAKPDSADALTNYGLVLQVLERFEDALAVFDTVLTIEQGHAGVLFNRGLSLKDLKRLEEARASFAQALVINPNYAEAYYHLGAILMACDRIEESLAAFRRHAELAYGAPTLVIKPAPPHKVRLDREQQDYIARINPRDDLPAEIRFHLEEGTRLKTPAVNPDNAIDEIARQWLTSKPQMVVIDNLLTDAALEGLYRFCLGSTVWRRVYNDGYIGALPEYGFACPLLAQIVDELRSTFPMIFGPLPLTYMWAFNYDNQLNGTKVHRNGTDFATVNINFWITPDEANLDPESGGLIVWDVEAPADWDSARHNTDAPEIRDFLAREKSKPIVIPYRANRAVIFDSNLFHETDRMVFKDGFGNRRINISLLYGDRPR